MADPISISFSLASLVISVGTFYRVHLRKVDSVIATMVAAQYQHSNVTFQFSFANLGTRPALLRDVGVEIYFQPDLTGMFSGECKLVNGELPKVIAAEDLYCVTLETAWTPTFLAQAVKAAEARGEKAATLFFVAVPVLWNPKGERMVCRKQIAQAVIDAAARSSTFSVLEPRSFPVYKPSSWLTQRTRNSRVADA